MASGGRKYPETYLEGMLECSICLDPVVDPHTLQKCLHTVCKVCMDRLRAEQNNDPPGVICPVCRKFSEEDMIMGNFFIKDLSELHKSVKERKRATCIPCSDNGKTVDASCRCIECKERLCQDCKTAHNTFKLLKRHKIVALGDDTEMVIVDNLVFCSIHTDKPLELYCEPCNTLMCITCKVTKHNIHESQTIDEALQHMIPEIEKSTEFIDANVKVIAKSLEEIEMKITETKESYDKCYNEVDEMADERKQQIEAARVKIKQDLQVKEKKEVLKLESVKENLKMKQRERENLRKVVRICLARARHVTLLSEFIQGGLQSKIKEMRDQPEAPVKIQVNHPQLNTNNTEWQKMKQQGIVGSVLYDSISVVVASGSVVTEGGSRIGSRYRAVNFSEYFSKNFRKVLEIKTGGWCPKLKLLKDKIWAPKFDGNVNVYDREGKIVKTIDIKSPMTVEQADNGDVFIACHSDSGLYLLDDNEAPQKICEGSFADVYVHRDKVYALEYGKKMIMEFCCRPGAGDVKQRWRKEKEWRVDDSHQYDKLIVTGHENLQFFVSHYVSDRISKYNTQGQCIKQFGSSQETGDGNLCGPWLCGVDRQSHLLVADEQHNVYKILDPGTGQWRATGMKGGDYVYDAILDGDGNLWLSQHNGREFTITKHETQ